MEQTRNIEDWPYPLITKLYQANDPAWVEVSQDTYWDQLDVLPPAEMTHNAFMVGEPVDHNPEGIPVYTAYVQYQKRFFGRDIPRNKFKPAILEFQIHRQFFAGE